VTNSVMKILLPNLLEISPTSIKDLYWVNTVLGNYVLLFSIVFILFSTEIAETVFLPVSVLVNSGPCTYSISMQGLPFEILLWGIEEPREVVMLCGSLSSIKTSFMTITDLVAFDLSVPLIPVCKLQGKI